METKFINTEGRQVILTDNHSGVGRIPDEELATRIFSIGEPETGKDPEERIYVVLYICQSPDNEDVKYFEVITGRRATYDFVKGIVDDIDIYESRVLAETVPYKDALNVYEFMVQMKKHITDTSFDIEDYNYAQDRIVTGDLDNLNDPNNFV